MIGTRVANIIKRFARDCDDVSFANFERVRGFDAERKLLRRPSEHCLPNLTRLWVDGNLGADSSHAVVGGILKRNVQIAVRLDFRARR